jgi:hypothetical protein
MALRVYIHPLNGFDRTREIYLLDENIDMARSAGKYQGKVLTPTEGGRLVVSDIQEGERMVYDKAFLRLPDPMMDEFLRSMTVELIRTGYVTGDPHGTKMRAVEEHLATLQRENDRHFELANKLVDAVTPAIRSHRK